MRTRGGPDARRRRGRPPCKDVGRTGGGAALLRMMTPSGHSPAMDKVGPLAASGCPDILAADDELFDR